MPLIWDVPVRLFHWLLVFFVSLSVISAEIGTLDAMDIHFYSGYAILSLLLFRLFWGFLGTPYARFSSFIRTPLTVYTYLRSWFSRTETSTKAYAGHNPAGGYMIVLMLGLLLAQATTGLFADDDIFTSGPLVHLVSDALSNRLTSLHHLISKFILAAVALHIIVIALYERYKKEPLVGAMWHGRKALAADGIHSNRLKLATVTLLLSALLVAALLTQL